jgi:hypothetical protein
VPNVLRAAGAQVEIQDDHFGQSATDEEWLREVGRRGRIVLTKDHRIRYRLTELEAVRAARVRAFVLTPRNLTGPQNGEVFAKALPRRVRYAIGNAPPFIAAVTKAIRIVPLTRG